MTQVAGRAGRGEQRGRAIIQTYNPTHPALAFAQEHDAGGFAEDELRLRKSAKFPPFRRAALIRVEGPEAHALETITRSLAEKMRTRARDDFEDGTWNILGPAPCAIEKIRDRVRYQIFVLTQSMKMRAALLDVIDEDVNLQRDLDKNNCRLILDVDPLRML